MSPRAAIGIDLGGTNLRAALIDDTGRILARRSCASEISTGSDAVIKVMAALAMNLLDEDTPGKDTIVGVGVGAPGPLRIRDGQLVQAVNLPGWTNVRLREELESRLKIPVVLENDGNAAAFGEWWLGAGDQRHDLVMLTLGTGVGGGVILNGRVFHGHFDNAAEIGHTIVIPGGIRCGCGQRGCLEQYASAAHIVRRVRKALDERRNANSGASSEVDDVVNASDVAERAQAGDPTCAKIWDQACHCLAVTCINIQHMFNPKHIVFGGGMSAAGSMLLASVNRHIHEMRWSLHDDFPTTSLATLGQDAGIVGAAASVFQETKQTDP